MNQNIAQKNPRISLLQAKTALLNKSLGQTKNKKLQKQSESSSDIDSSSEDSPSHCNQNKNLKNNMTNNTNFQIPAHPAEKDDAIDIEKPLIQVDLRKLKKFKENLKTDFREKQTNRAKNDKIEIVHFIGGG